MKSYVTKPFDYTLIPVDPALTLWRVSDKELNEHLETLSHNHSYEAAALTVQMGDNVACRGESTSPRWNRPVLLFYPGRGLCAKVLEDACIGARVGEQRTVITEDGEITLTVLKIVRRSYMPVGDALVREEHIPGVETLTAYRKWYRESNEPTRRLYASYRCALQLIHGFAAKSEFSLDQEEKDAWLHARVDSIYKAMVDAGMDPTIPKEGFDFLTEEQVKQNMYREYEGMFTEHVAKVYLAETMTGRSLSELVASRLSALAAEAHMTVEQLKGQAPEAVIEEKVAGDVAMEELAKTAYVQEKLEK